MRVILLPALLGAACVLSTTDAMAQFVPWRALGPRFHAPAFYAPYFYGPELVHARPGRKKPRSTKQVVSKHVPRKHVPRKHVSTKQVITECPAANTVISTGPGDSALIPLPDHELLTPTPVFDCEFETTSLDGASDQPQVGQAQGRAESSTEGARHLKLTYERECYRHAEIILRERLRLLQASVGETIKAAIFGPIKTESPQKGQ